MAVVVLTIVMTGYRPRYTCLPHWYLSFSVNVDAAAPNGGEHVASIITLIILPICLGDARRWQWSRPEDVPSAASLGRAMASILILRCQMAVLYAEAALGKITYPAWRDGRAMTAVLLDPVFGAPRRLHRLTQLVVSSHTVSLTLGIGLVIAELGIAMSMLGPFRVRRRGTISVVVLHGGIIVFMGLFSFGIIMIAAVMAAAADTRRRPHMESPPVQPATAKEQPEHEHRHRRLRPGLRVPS